jgi:hypothetical protein
LLYYEQRHLLETIIGHPRVENMPRVAVKSVADAGRKFPREFALLHQLGGSNKDVDTEVSNAVDWLCSITLLLICQHNLSDLVHYALSDSFLRMRS